MWGNFSAGKAAAPALPPPGYMAKPRISAIAYPIA